MTHLTVDEMLDFVSVTEWNSVSIALLTTVNGHIRGCEACRRSVRALQILHDEFIRYENMESFEDYLLKKNPGIRMENGQFTETEQALDGLDM